MRPGLLKAGARCVFHYFYEIISSSQFSGPRLAPHIIFLLSSSEQAGRYTIKFKFTSYRRSLFHSAIFFGRNNGLLLLVIAKAVLLGDCDSRQF